MQNLIFYMMGEKGKMKFHLRYQNFIFYMMVEKGKMKSSLKISKDSFCCCLVCAMGGLCINWESLLTANEIFNWIKEILHDS